VHDIRRIAARGAGSAGVLLDVSTSLEVEAALPDLPDLRERCEPSRHPPM